MQDKVFWSAAEKRAIAQSAIEIQHRRPDLAGLPLLREAMKALPPNRRRKLVSLSQVDWFEFAVQDEARRQAAETRPGVQAVSIVRPPNMEGDPYLPYFKEIAEANRRTEEAIRQLIELHERELSELASLRALLQERLRATGRRSGTRIRPNATNDQVRLSNNTDR